MNMQPHQLIEQGVQQAEIHNWESAKNSFQTALNIYRQIPYREGEGKTLGYLGNVHAALNLFVQAIDYYRQSLAIATEINDRQMGMITQKNLAQVLFEQGRQQIRVRAYQTALDNLQEALNIYRQIHDREWEGWTIFWQGTLYFACVDYEKAFYCYQQTLAIAREINNQQQLYQFLIAPIADLLPQEANAHVTFIPQSDLFLVPFCALQDELGKYLIEKHTILTASSIQILDLTQQQRQKVEKAALKDILILGNPTMPSVAPSIGEPPKQLPELPGAEEEAKAIASVFQSQPIIGTSATKEFVVKQMVSARIIHLATHGLLDDVRGLGSAIAFAPSDNDNGLLSAEEIFDLQLNTQLVVLSACDTGRGRLTGYGVIGLSRSFISAGVSSIIVSLWSIPDAPTALLMKQFYENLVHYDKAQALRQAMLKTMEKAPHPRNCAAFTLIGEAE